MSSREFFVRSRRVVTGGAVRPASLRIRGGRIAEVGPPGAPHSGAEARDFGDAVLLPGLVDTHVHVNDPGRADWEGFESATRAAAAGGVTTIFDMPLNSIPPDDSTVAALEAKRRAAAGRCHVDVGLWGGLVPGNAGEIAALSREGVRGFKAFLAPSGVPEFPSVDEAALREAMPAIAAAGATLLAHAELGGLLREAPAGGARVRDLPRVASQGPMSLPLKSR